MIVYKKDNVTVELVAFRQKDRSVMLSVSICKDAKVQGEVHFLPSEAHKKIDRIRNFGVGISNDMVMEILKRVNEVYGQLKIIPYLHGIGWQYDSNNEIFGFRCTETFDLKGDTLKVDYFKEKAYCKGDFDEWYACLKEYLSGNIKRQFIFATFVSSVLCGLMRDNVVLSIVGATSTGKSTVEKIGMSCFTSPLDNKFMLSFNSTENCVLKQINENNGLPVVIDDRSLASEKISSNFLYQLESGCEKARLVKGSLPSEQSRWNTAVILSAENSILFENGTDLKGKLGRVLEIHISQGELFESAEQAEFLEKLCENNYGLLGARFISYLFKNGIVTDIDRHMADKLESIRSHVTKSDGIINRLCVKIAIITLTADLLNEAFDFQLDTANMQEYLLQKCIENVEVYDELSRIDYDFDTVYKCIVAKAEQEECIVKDEGIFIDTALFKSIYKELADKIGFRTIKEFKESLKSRNLLIVNDGDFGYRTSSQRGYMIKVKGEGKNA